MEITEANLEKFRLWVVSRGRSPDTADQYVWNIRSCAADPAGVTHRLVAGKLAPNTLRANLAALRAWALFAGDAPLLKQLSDIRLPPARRVRGKQPLALEEWRSMVRHLKTCPMTVQKHRVAQEDEAMRHVLLLMAIRGLRCGDVLRMQRTEISRALATGKLVFEGKGRKRMEYDAAPIRAQLEGLVAFTGWERVRDLISTSQNHRVVSRRVRRASHRTAKAHGVLEMNPHRYRHTFATNYLNQIRGDPNAIVKLQKYMGWESMATAARYVDSVSQEELDVIGAGLMSGLLDA